MAKEREGILTLFCCLNLLNVSESPTTSRAVARDAIVVKGFFAETFTTLGENEKPGNDCVSIRLCCRKQADLRDMAI